MEKMKDIENINKKDKFCILCENKYTKNKPKWKGRTNPRNIPEEAKKYRIIPLFSKENPHFFYFHTIICNHCYSNHITPQICLINSQIEQYKNNWYHHTQKLEQKTLSGNIYYKYKKIEYNVKKNVPEVQDTAFVLCSPKIKFGSKKEKPTTIVMETKVLEKLITSQVSCINCGKLTLTTSHFPQKGINTGIICYCSSCCKSSRIDSLETKVILNGKVYFEKAVIDVLDAFSQGMNYGQYSLTENKINKQDWFDIVYHICKVAVKIKEIHLNEVQNQIRNDYNMYSYSGDANWHTRRNSSSCIYYILREDGLIVAAFIALKTTHNVQGNYIGTSKAMEGFCLEELLKQLQKKGILKKFVQMCVDGDSNAHNLLDKYGVKWVNDLNHLIKNFKKELLSEIGKLGAERVSRFLKIGVFHVRSLNISEEEKIKKLEKMIESAAIHYTYEDCVIKQCLCQEFKREDACLLDKIRNGCYEMNVTNLPKYLWAKIFSYLPNSDVQSVALTCTRFYHCIQVIPIIKKQPIEEKIKVRRTNEKYLVVDNEKIAKLEKKMDKNQKEEKFLKKKKEKLQKFTKIIAKIASSAPKLVSNVSTCRNEGLNGLKGQICPKDRVVNKQLQGKIALVILFNNLGRMNTFDLLAEALKISLPLKLVQNLTSMDKKRETNRKWEQENKKEISLRKQKRKRENKKIEEDAKASKENTYKPLPCDNSQNALKLQNLDLKYYFNKFGLKESRPKTGMIGALKLTKIDGNLTLSEKQAVLAHIFNTFDLNDEAMLQLAKVRMSQFFKQPRGRKKQKK